MALRQADKRFNPRASLREDSERAPVSKKKRQLKKAHHDWICEGVFVSDHAVLRWLEVKYGIDASQVRREMMGAKRSEVIKELKTCKVPIGEQGAKLVARDGVVVTVLKGDYRKYVNGNSKHSGSELPTG